MLDGVQLNLGCYLDRDNIQNVVNHYTKSFLTCKCLDSSRATRDSFFRNAHSSVLVIVAFGVGISQLKNYLTHHISTFDNHLGLFQKVKIRF